MAASASSRARQGHLFDQPNSHARQGHLFDQPSATKTATRPKNNRLGAQPTRQANKRVAAERQGNLFEQQTRANLRLVPATKPSKAMRNFIFFATGVMVFIVSLSVGLHALSLQTQAQIDNARREITELQEARLRLTERQAWNSSPLELTETAQRAGLVSASEVARLPKIAQGELASPPNLNPFALAQSG